MSCQLISRHSVRTSWEFSLEQLGISLTYEVTSLLGGRMKVPRLTSIGPMECWLATRNASSATMSHALQEAKKFLEQESSARVLQLLLISCLQGYSIQIFICFPISFSRIHFAAILYLCPTVPSRHSVPVSEDFWNKLQMTSLPPARMKATHLMSIRPNMWCKKLENGSRI